MIYRIFIINLLDVVFILYIYCVNLVTYAINHLQVTKVDVNEQNIQAVGFYKYIGFNVYKRSDLDGEGKEYPILHMQL